MERTRVIPGVAVCAAVTLVAIWLSELPFKPFTVEGKHPVEPVMIAILLGMIIANMLSLAGMLAPGIKFTAKKLLPLAIILVGARLDFMSILKVGATGVVMSVGTIALALGLFLLFVRWKWVETKLGLLLGIGTAICGGTAIVAAAPVIEAEEKDVSFGVATVTLLGLIGMFLLPVLGHLMHLSDQSFGIWAGLSIHQTPQVIAAGYSYNDAQTAGDVATTVKLARVCLLAPVIFVIGWVAARQARSSASGGRVNYARMFPLFVFGFLAMALLRTLGWLPDILIGKTVIRIPAWCETASKWLIVASMAAVGLETSFVALKQTGLRPLLLGLVSSVIISAVILSLLLILPAG